ncbi:MAG: hypothetical protein JWO38_6785, partial [Gemmataceae bacterium]|nr:hypothetical protein [Gemmataceae bacterium]
MCSTGSPAVWIAALELGPVPLTVRDWAWVNVADRVTVRVGSAAGVFVRGMLEEVAVTLHECATGG